MEFVSVLFFFFFEKKIQHWFGSSIDFGFVLNLNFFFEKIILNCDCSAQSFFFFIFVRPSVDDIEDNSQMRRGEPVAHSIFGEALTINVRTFFLKKKTIHFKYFNFINFF